MTKKKIKKILIANRGEIACRVMRSCQRMGIATVAVYSEADRNALHVEVADESVLIGPAPARESYLRMEAILLAARQTGADAIHPGYGFLSENAAFADACEKAGIVFIGPPPSAILAMGGKSQSKALMEKAGVPLVPGYHGDTQDEKFLLKEAEKIGFPVLIKASAGGGGKGMRVVEKAADFAEALEGAKREGKASFGDDRVLVEKYLLEPRHVEIQVFADSHGNCVYLFERDCSVQRRHQKVIEEAPAPGLSDATRQKMGEAAVAAAKAIHYVGAGTVEFLLDARGAFYFMEMNTRLQVEHPVTEMITGLDLVELQIRVAEGQALPFSQKDLKINGHAFEVRLYAEDPDNNFLPGAGKISFLRFPMESNVVRVDTGVREAPYGDGDVISIHYDPMIAKIITWGKDRATALQNLAQALDETHVSGPKNNLNFLRRLSRDAAFSAGKISTSFIKDHAHNLLPPPQELSLLTQKIAVAGLLHLRGEVVSADPWFDQGNWRIGGAETEIFAFKDNTGEYSVSAEGICVTASGYDTGFDADIDGKRYNAIVLRDGNRLTVMYQGYAGELIYLDPLHVHEAQDLETGRLHAPMPGKVVAIRVEQGVSVKKGQPLVIVEAMKMEHTIVAPADGVIEFVRAKVGDQVDEKFELVALK